MFPFCSCLWCITVFICEVLQHSFLVKFATMDCGWMHPRPRHDNDLASQAAESLLFTQTVFEI